jgi:hypothetical protein
MTRRKSSKCKTCPLARFVPILATLVFVYTVLQGTLVWKYEDSSSSLDQPSMADVSRNTNSSLGRTSTREPPPRRRWAYAFLLAGCDPEHPEKYIGIVYSVLVAAHNLREHGAGSQADILLLVQLSNEATATQLSDEDERLLKAMQIRIHYLPKPKSLVNFYTIQFEKFRILELTQYSRVIMMDGDVMPYCSLDYLFELSESGILKENVILAWTRAPSHGGFFLLRPNPGDYDKIEAIIRKREQKALSMPWPHFDSRQGWGHAIEPPDYVRFFRSKNDRIDKWDWYGVFAEQGLLYYWTKYVKRQVSIVIGSEVEHWGPASTEGGVRFEGTLSNLSHCACLPPGKEKRGSYGFLEDGFRGRDLVPYVDFAHFTGDSKPWESAPPSKTASSLEQVSDAYELWFYVLRKLKRELNIQADIEHLSTKPPPVGRFYTTKKMIKALRAKGLDVPHN